MASPSAHEYNNNIFINCRFDLVYQKIFHAMVYTITRCGFIPHCALEHDDASENRIDKIYRLIEVCRYGVHDISNIELDHSNNLPRFNMPFELGLFLSAKHFGNLKQRSKNIIIFEKEKFQSKVYLSDINGADPKAHNGDYALVMKHIRNWLTVSSNKRLPGYLSIQQEFNAFYSFTLPDMLQFAGLEYENVSFKDYCLLLQEWLTQNIKPG